MRKESKINVTVCHALEEVMGKYQEDCPSEDYKLAQILHSIAGWSPKCTHDAKCNAYKVIPKPRLLGKPKKAIVEYSGFSLLAEYSSFHPKPIVVDFNHVPYIFVEVNCEKNLADGEKVCELLNERLKGEIPNLEVVVQKKY